MTTADPWKDRGTLDNLVRRGFTQREIADELGCSIGTVSNWMDKLNVTPLQKRSVTFYTDRRGYEVLKVYDDGERPFCMVHQLVAIANGADPSLIFSGGEVHVHHANGVTWDNRPENLEVVTPSEHSREHEFWIERPRDAQGRWV